MGPKDEEGWGGIFLLLSFKENRMGRSFLMELTEKKKKKNQLSVLMPLNKD